MKTPNGYDQCYNAQAAVDSENQIILAADVTQSGCDQHQSEPMFKQVHDNVGSYPKNFDAGYWDETSLRKIAANTNLHAATTTGWKQKKLFRKKGSPCGRIPKKATFKERMERKLCTKLGKVI